MVYWQYSPYRNPLQVRRDRTMGESTFSGSLSSGDVRVIIVTMCVQPLGQKNLNRLITIVVLVSVFGDCKSAHKFYLNFSSSTIYMIK